MTAFEKCKAALGSYKVVRRFEEKLILRRLYLTQSGRLDYSRYKSARDISRDELLCLPDFLCVIVFSEAGVPPIKCRFKRASECLDYVTAVSPCVWIMNGDLSGVIEIWRGVMTACDLR